MNNNNENKFLRGCLFVQKRLRMSLHANSTIVTIRQVSLNDRIRKLIL